MMTYDTGAVGEQATATTSIGASKTLGLAGTPWAPSAEYVVFLDQPRPTHSTRTFRHAASLQRFPGFTHHTHVMCFFLDLLLRSQIAFAANAAAYRTNGVQSQILPCEDGRFVDQTNPYFLVFRQHDIYAARAPPTISSSHATCQNGVMVCTRLRFRG